MERVAAERDMLYVLFARMKNFTGLCSSVYRTAAAPPGMRDSVKKLAIRPAYCLRSRQ